jgi:hypothetical protein
VARSWSDWVRPKPSRRHRRGPVQTAFRLESVRVVRNDLTEADLELDIPRSKRGRKGEAAGAKELGGGVQRPLARMAARLFTAGRPG